MLSTMVESGPKDPSQMTIGIRTWPRAHLSQRSLSDLQYRIQLEKSIKLAKQSLEKPTPNEEIPEQSSYRQITQKLLATLERIRESRNDQLLAKAGRRKRRESFSVKNEPHFGSMILFGTLQRDQGKELQRGMALRKESMRMDRRRKSISILSDDVLTEEGEEEEGKILPDQLAVKFLEEERKEPLILQYSPLLTSLFFALLLLFLGAVIFQAIDAEIARQPFHRALLFAFQAVGTIGWGDVRASNKWSQAFCTVYTIFGVPIFFSALANFGRFISEFYTLDWLYLTCVVRPATGNEPKVQQHVPLRKSMYLLCIHQFIGVLLYGGLLKEYSPIAVIYFCMTSMATIGIGDFHPDAMNLAEALVAIIFLSIGMILLAALLIAFAYYFQILFFVYLRGWMLRKANERK